MVNVNGYVPVAYGPQTSSYPARVAGQGIVLLQFLLSSSSYPARAAGQGLILHQFLILPAQPQDIVFFSFPLLSSSFLSCRRSRRILFLTRFFFLLLLLLILPAQPQDLVSYSFLLSSSSSSSSSSFFFFFFLLATHLFHTLPYIWFWPNLLTVTGTLTTTHTLKMVGSGVTMGSLGSKRSFSPKTHQVLQIT